MKRNKRRRPSLRILSELSFSQTFTLVSLKAKAANNAKLKSAFVIFELWAFERERVGGRVSYSIVVDRRHQRILILILGCLVTAIK